MLSAEEYKHAKTLPFPEHPANSSQPPLNSKALFLNYLSATSPALAKTIKYGPVPLLFAPLAEIHKPLQNDIHVGKGLYAT